MCFLNRMLDRVEELCCCCCANSSSGIGRHSFHLSYFEADPKDQQQQQQQQKQHRQHKHQKKDIHENESDGRKKTTMELATHAATKFQFWPWGRSGKGGSGGGGGREVGAVAASASPSHSRSSSSSSGAAGAAAAAASVSSASVRPIMSVGGRPSPKRMPSTKLQAGRPAGASRTPNSFIVATLAAPSSTSPSPSPAAASDATATTDTTVQTGKGGGGDDAGRREREKERQLVFTAGAKVIPHPDKIAKGGEDAYFISDHNGGVLAVADGVSGWAAENVDPALFSKELMAHAEEALGTEEVQDDDPRKLLEVAHTSTSSIGAATAIVAILDRERGILRVANLGDCGLRIIRQGKLVYATLPQQHYFDCPYQLSSENAQTAADAAVYEIGVAEGDTIVMGSDGLFDNVFDYDIEAVVNFLDASEEGFVSRAALALASLASKHAQDRSYDSPYAKEAVLQGHDLPWWRKVARQKIGGKIDDITVVVGHIVGVTRSTEDDDDFVDGGGEEAKENVTEAVETRPPPALEQEQEQEDSTKEAAAASREDERSLQVDDAAEEGGGAKADSVQEEHGVGGVNSASGVESSSSPLSNEQDKVPESPSRDEQLPSSDKEEEDTGNVSISSSGAKKQQFMDTTTTTTP